jgi:GxxExxY protein
MAYIQHPLIRTVIGRAIEVHHVLGPGLMESSYSRCFAYELIVAGIPFRQEVRMPIQYKDVTIECGYRADFIIDGWLLIEVKSVETILPIHIAQTMTYLRLSEARQALILNFNCIRLVDGIRSLVLSDEKRRRAGVPSDAVEVPIEGI